MKQTINIMYSYQDCWKYVNSLNIRNKNLEIRKKSLIEICQVSSAWFWSNFSLNFLTFQEFSTICFKAKEHLKNNCPLPYLTKKVIFYRWLFEIEKSVYIPQKDTEIVIENTLKLIEKKLKRKEINILDIGTGCGNIAISLAKLKPFWQITAIDINPEALEIAKKNSYFHNIKNINFCQSNLFDKLEKQKFDVIISNPPYISKKEYSNLSLLTKKQPIEALLAKENGYSFYRQIIQQSSSFLATKFILILEIGHQQMKIVTKMILRCFDNIKIEIFNDYGGNCRMIAAYNL